MFAIFTTDCKKAATQHRIMAGAAVFYIDLLEGFDGLVRAKNVSSG